MRGALAIICLLGWTASAEAACRQALALGLDVSGSVDAQEYRLQLDGLASALEDPDVRAAFLQFPETPVRLMVYEWSGMSFQRPVIHWREITTPAQLDHVAQHLRSTQAQTTPNPSTALASAMLYGVDMLMAEECWQRTLDISADGPGNIGTHPEDLDDHLLGDVTINALVIGPENRANTTKNLLNVKTLEEYYGSFVIHGPGAFVEAADDHADFARAMARKLIRELNPPALSWLSSGNDQ